MKFLVILLLFVCSIAPSQNADDASENKIEDFFNVKPGGELLVYERTLHKYKCTFTYRAQGGTNEQWQFMFEKAEDGKQLQCTVARGATSYLFFEDFTMSVTGPKVHIEDYEATSSSEQRLKPEEVNMNAKKRMVQALEGSFQKKLERVTVIAKIGKKKKQEEL
ncbi:hypothetical protein ACOMHN_015563 [Nucella lapillus]